MTEELRCYGAGEATDPERPEPEERLWRMTMPPCGHARCGHRRTFHLGDLDRCVRCPPGRCPGYVEPEPTDELPVVIVGDRTAGHWVPDRRRR